MDRSVRPQDDFFRFVNGLWSDKTPIPADRSNYGTFAELRDRAQEAVRGILEAEAIRPGAPGSVELKVGAFYKSFSDEGRIESLGVHPLGAAIEALQRVSCVRELPAVFVEAASYGVRLPLLVSVAQDPRRSDVYAVLVSQSGLGMPDRDYYLRSDEKFVAVRKKYTEYVARLLALARQKDPEGAAQRILAFETALAEEQWDRTRNRDRDATYNKFSLDALQASTPNFDWRSYLAQVLPPSQATTLSEVI